MLYGPRWPTLPFLAHCSRLVMLTLCCMDWACTLGLAIVHLPTLAHHLRLVMLTLCRMNWACTLGPVHVRLHAFMLFVSSQFWGVHAWPLDLININFCHVAVHVELV